MNKVMHHKFVLIDGPRDVRERAATAKLVMGSANWSATAATEFDENTVFIEGSAEMMAAFQHEFDKLWLGSREFEGAADSQGQSTVKIKPSDVSDDAGIEGLFTSDNFTPGGADGTTWRVDRSKMTLTDAWNAAIDRAETSIHVATTHLRLRPFAEKLIAIKQAKPSLDIQVYLDQQEYISPSGDAAQKAELMTCLAAATTEARRFACLNNNFLFSKALVDAGITVRFKSYAYRWDHSYAAQMHSKYMVVDGKELLTGSFNASMNSEQATFESGLHVFGTQHAALVAKFEQNFESITDIGRDKLAPLRAKIDADTTIPIVFPSMSLTYQEFGDLRALIRTECPAVDSEEFRSNASAHRTCTK
jgi:phosphatidylserine/phosphatidylglycerophosphate/cardiolipin synthase-like enzyme